MSILLFVARIHRQSCCWIQINGRTWRTSIKWTWTEKNWTRRQY